MSESQARPNPIVPLAGILTGVITVVSVNFFVSGPFPFPWSEGTAMSAGPVMSPVVRETAAVTKAPEGGEGVYKTICVSCHQADGKGMTGAFPPLAGSSWVAGDPETPIRIVIKGLSGPVDVDGVVFNSVMPPPAGLDDAKIAEVLTFVRSSFGNKASAVTVEQVAKVRAEIEGRATMWTAAELSALRAAVPAVEPEPAPAVTP
jgi:mono/diheme cytochrome c family protein